MPDKTTTLTLRLPESKKNQLKAISKLKDKSINQLVVDEISEFLIKHETTSIKPGSLPSREELDLKRSHLEKRAIEEMRQLAHSRIIEMGAIGGISVDILAAEFSRSYSIRIIHEAASIIAKELEGQGYFTHIFTRETHLYNGEDEPRSRFYSGDMIICTDQKALSGWADQETNPVLV